MNYNPYSYNFPQNDNSILWVQGEAGAKSFMVAPGKSVLLMDSESQRFYIKSSDASGMPMPLRVFEYNEKHDKTPEKVEEVDYVTRDEYDAIWSKLDALEKAIKKPIPARKKEVIEDE